MDNILGNEVIKNLILVIATEVILVISIAPLREAILRHKVVAAVISANIIYYFAFNFSIPPTPPDDVEISVNDIEITDIYQATKDAQAKADAEVQEQDIKDDMYDSTCIKYDIPSIINLNQSEPEELIYEIILENAGNVEWDLNGDTCLVIEIDETNCVYIQSVSDDGSHRVSPSDTRGFIINFNKEGFHPDGDTGFYSFYITRKDRSNSRWNENTAIPFGESKNIRIEFVD